MKLEVTRFVILYLRKFLKIESYCLRIFQTKHPEKVEKITPMLLKFIPIMIQKKCFELKCICQLPRNTKKSIEN